MTHLDYFRYANDTMILYNRRIYPSTFTKLANCFYFVSMPFDCLDNTLTLHRLNPDLSIITVTEFECSPISTLSPLLRDRVLA